MMRYHFRTDKGMFYPHDMPWTIFLKKWTHQVAQDDHLKQRLRSGARYATTNAI